MTTLPAEVTKVEHVQCQLGGFWKIIQAEVFDVPGDKAGLAGIQGPGLHLEGLAKPRLMAGAISLSNVVDYKVEKKKKKIINYYD